MKKNLYLFSLALIVLASCKNTVEDPATSVLSDSLKAVNSIAAVGGTNVKQLGIKGDGYTDDRPAIQAAIRSNKTLFFPKGVYKLGKEVNISRIANLKITGEPGTIFTSGQDVLFFVSGSITNLEIDGITFKSTRVNKVDNPQGLIFIGNYGANDIMDNIRITNCTFTNPNTNANGIKLVSEGLNAVAKNISITKNKFESIGRFAVEFQNHQWKTQLPRFRDYEVSNNYFNDVGTVEIGLCVSMSGYAVNGKINYNEFKNMRMDDHINPMYAVENAGTIGMETIGNHIYSTTYGFTGIMGSHPTPEENKKKGQPFKRNWIIKDNVIELTGTEKDKNMIRGMQIENVDGYTITNNKIISDGIAINLVNCKNGKIQNNQVKVNNDYVVYFRKSSAYNVVTANDFTSYASNKAVFVFEGAGSTGNSIYSNKVVKPTNSPLFSDAVGAKNSVK